jgi:hypothetical protein
MSGILQRLAHITRVQVHDLLAKYWPDTSSIPAWDTHFDGSEHTADNTADATTSSEGPTNAGSGLPYSQELARCYDLLDLPFGTPMEQVTRRWKAYLKKCHPDLHANDPAKQAEATELTQQLNGAYKNIKLAWEH